MRVMMRLEPSQLEQVVFKETGLDLQAKTYLSGRGQRNFRLKPRNLPQDHTFTIRTAIEWRRIHIDFEPGKFAGELLRDMGQADEDGRNAFRAILSDCIQRGAELDFRVNGTTYPPQSEEPWQKSWSRLVLHLSKGQLTLGLEEGDPDSDIITRWTGRFAAAITAIMPIEERPADSDAETKAYQKVPSQRSRPTDSNVTEETGQPPSQSMELHASHVVSTWVINTAKLRKDSLRSIT
jgi:5-methylcytosine-specific restriction protein A